MIDAMTDNVRSEPLATGGSVAVGENPEEVRTTVVGENPRGAIPTAEARETAASVESGIDRSESGSAEGSSAVGESPRGAVPTAIRDTAAGDGNILRDGASRNNGSDGTRSNCCSC